MNERGQIFTLDMFFALALTVLVVSYSGLALEQARKQAESYALRYSLERTVNDAADVLVKTPGRPSNWEDNIEMLETLGLAKENQGNPIQNILSVKKFGQLKRLAETDNWTAPANADAVQAIRELFGDSDNFEIKVTHTEMLAREKLDTGKKFNLKTTLFGVKLEVKAENKGAVMKAEVKLKWDGEEEKVKEEATDFVIVAEGGGILAEVIARSGVIEVWYRVTFWEIWPEWDVKDSSGVDNSLEVAVVRRLVIMRFLDVVAESWKIGLGQAGQVTDNLEFEIPPGGLEAFDWFIIVTTGVGKERREVAQIFVNREITGTFDYKFESKKDDLEDTFPEIHGGMGNDDLPAPPHEGLNYLNIKVAAGKAKAWVKVYIVALPACSPWETANLAMRLLTATLEVKLWR